jgi:hypothetical protein
MVERLEVPNLILGLWLTITKLKETAFHRYLVRESRFH